jgi:hypothetical protein
MDGQKATEIRRASTNSRRQSPCERERCIPRWQRRGLMEAAAVKDARREGVAREYEK